MHYLEVLPDNIFSNHIESYWHFSAPVHNSDQAVEILIPTCTFNIIFTENPCLVKTESSWNILTKGASFFGQRSNCLLIKSKSPIELYGIRFKPFAFSHLINTPIYQLNDRFIPLQKLLKLDTGSLSLLTEINKHIPTFEKFSILNDFMYILFKTTLTVDEKLRAQLNYIMDRKGSLKINELSSEFGTSKVTLRKHFINKVGLTPKKVAKIWRMNHFLDMKAQKPTMNLTELSLEAGFYDQAHFIREFKQLFDIPPRAYFQQNMDALRIAQVNISKRFSNQYDPR
jgi:AraC-like DNA-binding protein